MIRPKRTRFARRQRTPFASFYPRWGERLKKYKLAPKMRIVSLKQAN
jgi:hypothetical protein